MYKIINRHVYEIASGENITLCDIVADASTDLPGADDQALYKIAFGSFAFSIADKCFYCLDSSGTWTAADINASDFYTKLQIDTLLSSKQDTLTFDNVPTQDSNNPVKSGGVYTALSNKQDTLTFDNVPTQDSNNPVKSGGVYAAIEITDISDKITAKSGYTINSLTKIYKQGSHIFGQIIINKSGGNFGTTPETTATFDIGYRPIAQQIQVCMIDTSDYGTQYIGHCDIAPADHPYFAGNVSISSYQSNIGNVANLRVDFIV